MSQKVKEVIETGKRYQPFMPKKWHIIFHNDEFTPFEFVEELLMKVFKKNSEQAKSIATEIHKKGKGSVGTFTHEIAETRFQQCMFYINETEYPLLITMEEA